MGFESLDYLGHIIKESVVQTPRLRRLNLNQLTTPRTPPPLRRRRRALGRIVDGYHIPPLNSLFSRDI